jgi:heme oxygenase (biliverdin-IX-beta and delta-forming)
MFLSMLRQATRIQHAKLESVVDFEKYLGTRRGYCHMLCLMYGVIAPFEERLQLFNWTTSGIDFSPRRKTRWLETDLQALGCDVQRIKSNDCSELLPQISNLVQAIGCLYVIRGSTLGGRVIGQRLKNQLGITAANGGAFYFSYGEHVLTKWTDFCESAKKYCDTSDKREEAVAAAIETFECFSAWFEANKHASNHIDICGEY